MLKIRENLECYSHPTQREILTGILKNEIIRNDFFLTGGTALSVFYLHHRTSIDLDFFTVKKPNFNDIYLWIAKSWPGETRKINQNEFLLQMLIKEIKVDIVFDPLSFDEQRENYRLEEKKFVIIDSLESIASNKMTALTGRREIKDFVDFYFINKKVDGLSLDSVYNNARKKEAMFDDPPTVAYQLEGNLAFIKENPDIFPEILIEFDRREFYTFYENLVERIYRGSIKL